MTIAHEGYKAELTGYVMIHSLRGLGTARDLRIFLKRLDELLKDQVLMTTVENPQYEKAYKRFGFSETGTMINGHKILVRTV